MALSTNPTTVRGRSYRARKREQRLCASGGCYNPAVSDRRSCTPCLTARIQMTVKRQAKYRAQGLCNCGRKQEPMHVSCFRCLAVMEDYRIKNRANILAKRKRLREQRRDQHLCSCGAQRVEGKTLCETCVKANHRLRTRQRDTVKEANHRKAWRLRKIAAGLCVYNGCHADRGRTTVCESHQIIMNKSAARYRLEKKEAANRQQGGQ